jgi:hypothetical protein
MVNKNKKGREIAGVEEIDTSKTLKLEHLLTKIRESGNEQMADVSMLLSSLLEGEEVSDPEIQKILIGEMRKSILQNLECLILLSTEETAFLNLEQERRDHILSCENLHFMEPDGLVKDWMNSLSQKKIREYETYKRVAEFLDALELGKRVKYERVWNRLFVDAVLNNKEAPIQPEKFYTMLADGKIIPHSILEEVDEKTIVEDRHGTKTDKAKERERKIKFVRYVRSICKSANKEPLRKLLLANSWCLHRYFYTLELKEEDTVERLAGLALKYARDEMDTLSMNQPSKILKLAINEMENGATKSKLMILAEEERFKSDFKDEMTKAMKRDEQQSSMKQKSLGALVREALGNMEVIKVLTKGKTTDKRSRLKGDLQTSLEHRVQEGMSIGKRLELAMLIFFEEDKSIKEDLLIIYNNHKIDGSPNAIDIQLKSAEAADDIFHETDFYVEVKLDGGEKKVLALDLKLRSATKKRTSEFAPGYKGVTKRAGIVLPDGSSENPKISDIDRYLVVLHSRTGLCFNCFLYEHNQAALLNNPNIIKKQMTKYPDEYKELKKQIIVAFSPAFV